MSGTWELNVQKSSWGKHAKPTGGTVVIEHHEPSLKYSGSVEVQNGTETSVGKSSFAYDGAGQLVTQSEPTGMVKYTRDALGRVATRQVVGQPTVTYTYDADLRLTGEAISDPTTGPAAFTYTYDPNGNRTSLTAPTGKVTYTYDANSRLMSSSGPSGSVTFCSSGSPRRDIVCHSAGAGSGRNRLRSCA